MFEGLDMVILRICVATSVMSFGEEREELVGWLPGLEPRVAVSRTPSADATWRFTLGNIHDPGGVHESCL